jgi:hypothetical protein
MFRWRDYELRMKENYKLSMRVGLPSTVACNKNKFQEFMLVELKSEVWIESYRARKRLLSIK